MIRMSKTTNLISANCQLRRTKRNQRTPAELSVRANVYKMRKEAEAAYFKGVVDDYYESSGEEDGDNWFLTGSSATTVYLPKIMHSL